MVRLRGRLRGKVSGIGRSIRSVLPFIGEESGGEEEGDKYGNFSIETASSSLIVIPETDDITEVDVRYPLIQPFADAHIYWDEEGEELVYEVEEPELDDREQRIFGEIRESLEKKIDVPISELETSEEVVDYLVEQVDDITTELGLHLNDSERNKILYYIYRNFGGLNEIEPLMNDPYIEDIGCSGTGIPIYIIHSKFGSIRTELEFEDEGNLKDLIVKLAERANKYVSYSDPLLDGTLPDGSRVNASLTEDVTTKGPTFSIRKFQEVPYSAVDLLDLGTANTDIMAYMWMALQYQKSALIIGGTATGKTTFLNSVVSFIPPEMKIVSIEDTRELQLPHENWIPSVTRSSSAQEEEEDITMYELLRESFRQNPDYVVVGEVRGEEASVLFQGMASGHPSLSTMHAATPGDVVSRLTTSPINLSPALVETLDVIVSVTHAREWGENARRVQAVYEIEDISDEGTPRTNEYFSWTSVDDTFSEKEESNILDKIRQQYGLSSSELEDELEDRKEVLEWMLDNGYTHFHKVSRVVSEYYKDKESVMDMISEGTGVGFEDLMAEESRERMHPDIESAREELERAVEESMEVDYDEVVDDTVDEVKRRVREEELEPRKVLEAERRGAGRGELIEWLEEKAEVREETGVEEEAGGAGGAEGSELFGEAEEVETNPFD
ncbi:MAG: type II/IV secretion system ATPase subunit [Candidatus Nanohaloarchaea archaeon]|nr:type II/IV secretion system ATPase subunit [Candidatus Nanohaloarchaea archaeon]